ncbi:hypothetical protein [Armatimonas sp.]|uniref:hypothetical protein n=1 Tax=Armatimonas sp. TaxID=1872638 RepID=UPI00374CACB2
MQRQQENEPQNRPKQRRSVGELLIAWLVLLWGVGSGVAFLPFALMNFREKHFTFPLPILISDALILLQAALCVASGLCVLLRLRLFAKYGLMAVALCFLGMGAMNVWLVKWVLVDVGIILWSAIFVIVAAALLLLGRWLGHQEG